MVRARLARRWLQQDPLNAICEYALDAPGKLFRPILLLESARAFDAPLEPMMSAAVGTESGHVASLVHDDVIDGDELRRGRTSVYSKFGTDRAIVSGDALIFDLFKSLAECHGNGIPAERVVSVLEIVADCGIELCRGQVLEAEIAEKQITDLDTYFRMIRMKTAALFRCACECGAVLAGAPRKGVASLRTYGENLGLAFQIRDDVLEYEAESRDLGKSKTSDVRNRRLTLPILLARQRACANQLSRLESAFSPGPNSDDGWLLAKAVLDETGALTAAGDCAKDHSRIAREALVALPESASRDLLNDFARKAVTRTK
jgi:Geranylgeranyl pyrophosphate synthase